MDFDKYQYEAFSYCMPSAANLEYLITGLAAEAGEVAGKYAKYIRDETSRKTLHEDLEKELGDVLWFVAILSEMMGSNLSEIAQMNIDKLESRAKRGVLKGSGDAR
jgi:NTP pyrophosphatase (non-canonical NTP hydrolase)